MAITVSRQINALASIRPFARRIRDDSRGATLVEYSILIGLLSAGVIGLIAPIGEWLVLRWSWLVGQADGLVKVYSDV
jgi:pilus assembly protein Flp/PilA